MKKSVIILAAVALAAACSPEENTVVLPSSKVFRASIEQGTRTYTENGKVYWYNGDAISIFDKGNSSSDNVKYTYGGETGTTSGTFTSATALPVSIQTLQYIYGVYPYMSDNIILEEGKVIAYIYPSQDYDYDSFGDGSNAMVAVSENESLQFKNVAGYLNVRLYGDNSKKLKSVQVESNGGEYICGDALVEITPEAEPVISPYPGNGYANKAATVSFDYYDTDVFLDPSSPLDVWVALTPGVIQSGITVTVTAIDGSKFSVVNNNPLTIKRGVCTPTAPLEVTFPVVDANYLDAFTGVYTFNTTSPWNDDCTGTLQLLAYDSPLGNVAFYGSIDGYLETLFYGQCGVDGIITVPSGQIVGIYTEEEVDYDVKLYVASSSGYYSEDIPFTVTADHEMTYVYGQYGYALGLVMCLDDVPQMWYDRLTVNSIVYVPSSAVASYAKARGYDTAKGLNNFRKGNNSVPELAITKQLSSKIIAK